VLDDQPVALRSPKGQITSVPYTVDLNDVVITAVQQQPSDEMLRLARRTSTGSISRARRRRG
jgi:hypothetical protein